MPLTSSVSATWTDQSTEMKLQKSADRLVIDFDQSIKSELKKGSPQEAKKLLLKHLERALRLQYPKASNLNQVISTSKMKLADAIDLLAKEIKPKR